MFWKEIRGVLRSLRKNLAFTSLTVSILALGMGASIAVFAIVNAVLLKPPAVSRMPAGCLPSGTRRRRR